MKKTVPEGQKWYPYSALFARIFKLRWSVDCGIPSKTSYRLIHSALSQLPSICDNSDDILESIPYAAPAAAAMVPSFVNGAIGAQMSTHEVWVQAYQPDPGMKSLLSSTRNRHW